VLVFEGMKKILEPGPYMIIELWPKTYNIIRNTLEYYNYQCYLIDDKNIRISPAPEKINSVQNFFVNLKEESN